MKGKTKHMKNDTLFQFWYAFLFTQVLMTQQLIKIYWLFDTTCYDNI